MEKTGATPPLSSPPFPGGGEMRARCRALDWSATPLGPAEQWPQSLRTAAEMVLGSAFPGILVWGPERVQIYNDAYAPLIGRRHPAALGMPTHDCWPELREMQEPIFARVFRGETVHLSEAPYPLDLHGRVEMRAFDASFSPVLREDGEVGGSFSTLFDVTGRGGARLPGRARTAARRRAGGAPGRRGGGGADRARPGGDRGRARPAGP